MTSYLSLTRVNYLIFDIFGALLNRILRQVSHIFSYSFGCIRLYPNV